MKLTRQESIIVENNIGLARSVAHTYVHKCTLDWDDLHQIGSIGLMKAAKSYDSSKGVKFSTYATRIITNEVLSALRSVGREYENSGGVDSLDLMQEETDTVALDGVDPEVAAVSSALVADIKDMLEPVEFAVLWLRSVEGHTQKYVAEKSGVSQGQVCRIERKVKAKLKKVINY